MVSSERVQKNFPEVVIIGSIALDSIETPAGKVENVLGGSASYAGLVSSFFAKTGIVGSIGKDFPQDYLNFFKSRGINIDGIERSQNNTFKWVGRYGSDINVAETLKTELNAMAEFNPKIPDNYANANFLFLGNFDPEKQLAVLTSMKKRPKFVVADTMNFWIENKRESVLEIVKKTDVCLLNDAEARQLFNTPNLVTAAKKILELNSKIAIIKKGEHGCLLFTKSHHFFAPAYPLENVIDPTGCGDSFAGALIGYLSQSKNLKEKTLRKAIVVASAVASFNAESFSLNRLREIKKIDINKRVKELKKITLF